MCAQAGPAGLLPVPGLWHHAAVWALVALAAFDAAQWAVAQRNTAWCAWLRASTAPHALTLPEVTAQRSCWWVSASHRACQNPVTLLEGSGSHHTWAGQAAGLEQDWVGSEEQGGWTQHPACLVGNKCKAGALQGKVWHVGKCVLGCWQLC